MIRLFCSHRILVLSASTSSFVRKDHLCYPSRPNFCRCRRLHPTPGIIGVDGSIGHPIDADDTADHPPEKAGRHSWKVEPSPPQERDRRTKQISFFSDWITLCPLGALLKLDHSPPFTHAAGPLYPPNACKQASVEIVQGSARSDLPVPEECGFGRAYSGDCPGTCSLDPQIPAAGCQCENSIMADI
jgi:hypothetical protein